MARTLTEYNGVMCWTDIDQVLSLTGETVDSTAMATAQSVLNLVTDVYPDQVPEDLRSGDRRRLQDMLCYQAPWMAGRVDFFREVMTNKVQQDGVAADYPHQYAQLLAPLANIGFQRLSWNRAGITTGPSAGARYPDAAAALNAVLTGQAEDTSGIGGYVPGRPFS